MLPLLRLAMFFKHPAYRNEQEYRFMHIQKEGAVSDVKYRARPHSLVRFKEDDWRSVAPTALKEIVIGPAADQASALPFVKNCLRAFHSMQNSIDVRRSPIPYRAN